MSELGLLGYLGFGGRELSQPYYPTHPSSDNPSVRSGEYAAWRNGERERPLHAGRSTRAAPRGLPHAGYNELK